MPEKTILVVGGSSDIGVALIEKLLLDEWNVLAHCNKGGGKLSPLLATAPQKIRLLQADLAEVDSVSQLTSRLSDMPDLQAVVFLAAPRVRNARFRDLSWQDFALQLDVQLRASIQILQGVLPGMVKARRGRIVFLLSSYTLGIPPAALAHYVTTKHAVLGLMRALASEYASKGITVNAVSPSMVDTAFLADIPERLVELTAEQHPMKRVAVTGDVVPLLRLLLSDSAAYISGANIPVTGASVA